MFPPRRRARMGSAPHGPMKIGQAEPSLSIEGAERRTSIRQAKP